MRPVVTVYSERRSSDRQLSTEAVSKHEDILRGGTRYVASDHRVDRCENYISISLKQELASGMILARASQILRFYTASTQSGCSRASANERFNFRSISNASASAFRRGTKQRAFHELVVDYEPLDPHVLLRAHRPGTPLSYSLEKGARLPAFT
jgi:hypothetical protein